MIEVLPLEGSDQFNSMMSLLLLIISTLIDVGRTKVHQPSGTSTLQQTEANQPSTRQSEMANTSPRHMPVLGNVHPIKIENFDIFSWRHFSARSSFYIINWYGYPRGSHEKHLKEIVSPGTSTLQQTEANQPSNILRYIRNQFKINFVPWEVIKYKFDHIYLR